MPLPQSLFDEVTASLTESGRLDLVKKLRADRQNARDLTSTEAIPLL